MKRTRQIQTAALLMFEFAGTAFAQDRAITIVMPYAFDNIDSCNSSSEVGLIVRENVVEALTHVDAATGEPTPRLATPLPARRSEQAPSRHAPTVPQPNRCWKCVTCPNTTASRQE